jgi:hypothetical protein
LTSLVLSSPEMNTKSRWKQVLTVSIWINWPFH